MVSAYHSTLRMSSSLDLGSHYQCLIDFEQLLDDDADDAADDAGFPASNDHWAKTTKSFCYRETNGL